MSIKLDVGNNKYIITGDIDYIKTSRLIRTNFQSIGANFDLENKFIIPFEFDTKDKKYKEVKGLCERYNIEYFESDALQQLLHDLKREEESFSEFSEKARNIRNNNCEIDEFKSFVSAMKNNFKRELYPLQLLSAYHLAFAQNACNFSVPGAGKTSIVYAAYAYLKNLPEDDKKHINKIFIICPLSAFGPWKSEYVECFGPTQTEIIAELVNKSPKERRDYYYSPVEVTLVSYQTASQSLDIEAIQDFLGREKVMLVLDEAHYIKNSADGKWAKAILKLAKHASSRVVLTGTPAPNGYQDLNNLFEFIWPEKNIITFPLHYLRNTVNFHSSESKGELVDQISPFFMRIKKSDLGLPEPIEMKPTIVQMSKIQQKIYEYIEASYIPYFEQHETVGTLRDARARLMRLRQCAINPKLLRNPLKRNSLKGVNLGIDDREIIDLIHSSQLDAEPPPKFERLASLLQSIIEKDGPDGRAVVWSFFVDNIDEVSKYLKGKGIESEIIYGKTPIAIDSEDDDPDILTRERIIRRFHEPDCPYKVIIANPLTAGESISLHKACRNGIYLEKDFNAGRYIQSKERIHRYGLDKNDIVTYYHLITKDSIDVEIHSRLLEKERLMLGIIESEKIPLLDLDSEEEDLNDDIQAVIRGYHERHNIKSA